MAEKREPDNLALDMMQCKADGFGCNYGRWKAWHVNPVREMKPKGIPESWQVCPQCGRSFKPKKGHKQVYCEYECQRRAQRERNKNKNKYKEYYRSYAERKRAERKLDNESNT